MAIAALVLYTMWFLLAFGLRTIVQVRRTGDTGWRAGRLPGRTGSVEWWAGSTRSQVVLTGPVGRCVTTLWWFRPYRIFHRCEIAGQRHNFMLGPIV
ncbi:MAG: hypothetical protein QOD92_558 [Acidimicrobiaceae bacterium]